MKSERISLLASTKSYSSYGTDFGETDSSSAKSEGSRSNSPKKVTIATLFRYATTRDKWIIAFGTVFSILHGAGAPAFALIFGEMTDTMINHSLYGFADSQNGSETSSTLSSVNLQQYQSSPTPSSLLIDPETSNPNSGLNNVAPVPERLLTREEFSQFMIDYAFRYAYVAIAMFITSLLQVVLWEWSCERQAYRLRQEFLYQVFRQEISWYDKHQTGDLAIKLSDDLERVREGIGHKFSMIIQLLSTFVLGFFVGFVVNWQLTLLVLAVSPFIAGASAYTAKLIATGSEREHQKYGRAGSVAQEVLSSIKTVASFGGEQREINRYQSRLMDGLRLARKKYREFAIGIGVVQFVVFSSYAISFWYGCKLLNDNILTPGNIFTIFLSVLMAAFSVGNAVPFIAILGVARGAAQVVFEIIDSVPAIDPYSKAGLTPERVIGRIQFRNVSFRYPSRKQIPVLDNFTVDIEPGKTVAFVGQSGVGKSTLVSLILRFYDPDSGAILIDGHDIKALNLAWLRHHIGIVSQEPVLFGTTIYENICYGRDYVSPDEVVIAARMANAHEFISLLPQGYETLVGERGAQLSGGQKQRIAIARALVRDPRILLLDEATSALDARSESAVQSALDKARMGRTTIIIAHRLSTIKDADVIYVLKDGAVAEYGTHAQLFAKGDLYYDLVTAQMSIESVEQMEAAGDASFFDSTDDSLGEFDIEIEKRKRRRTRKGKRKFKVQAIPDPDRARMAEEAEELDARYPGICQILGKGEQGWPLFAGFVGAAIAGSTMPAFAVMYAEMFRTFTWRGEKLMNEATIWSLVFLGLAFVSGFSHWLRTICISSAGEHLTMRLRVQSFISIVRQPVGWFDRETNSPGRLSTRLARDAPLVKAAAGHRLATFVTCIVIIAESLTMSFYFNWQLALVLLAGYPLLIFAAYLQTQLQTSGFQKDAMLMEDCGRIATESIQNIRTVQALGQEKLFFTKYLESLFPLYVEAHKQGLIFGLTYAFAEGVTFSLYAVGFGYAGYLISVSLIDPPDTFRVFFAQAFCAMAIGQALSIIPDYSKANLAAGLMFNLIEMKSSIDPFGPEGLRPNFDGRITFSDVHFRYPSREQFSVLNGLSFDLQEGQSLAIIGPSGGGKSTIISLIERFYDVTSGQVLIDGYDVRSLNVAHLRKSIGIVTQEPVLFDCTIRENIAYGYTSDFHGRVPEDLILEAAKSANIHNFITGLPQGYETNVGERGTQLSGGQKQRIAIARALIRNPKILLLDEATSALDSESEKIVQEALDKARAGRTCIIIAHRLSTIQNADYVAVINRGRIVEMGTHEQLRARKGLFYKLTKKQQILPY